MPMAQRFCRGEFSEATKQLLRAELESKSIVRSLALCETCGRHVMAENKGGEWVPITHHPPLAAKAYKSGGEKR
jgi:hypothetical protein